LAANPALQTTETAFAPESAWPWFALVALALVTLSLLVGVGMRKTKKKGHTYEDLLQLGDDPKPSEVDPRRALACQAVILASTFFTLVYLYWRVLYSIPFEWGWLAVACNVVLLVVEVLGFVESLVHFRDVAGMRSHPLPACTPEEYPDVDVFIATYNEPDYLLEKTINGCKHLEYPDASKVHVWLCDDKRRPQMRSLAERMGIGYFDRPDNEGAKAGNLNAAMARTSSPYVVTLDADMIVQRNFLMQTIPYFIDSERRNAGLPADKQIKLGLLQTPQCFHDPDVFQHGLYAEHSIPNEQDYFYRTIEVAKTASNSVIYGGSNTVLAREALEAIGGFYTGSITEDFATGLLIESSGYVSLALPDPLASGSTPHTFAEHIQQRTRWGRGVIVTARKLGIMRRRGLTPAQKTSYWSSVAYWYSPIKNLIYLLSPLLFAVFNIPVFNCSWLDLLVYWMPMFIAQFVCLRVVSQGRITTRWSGIHETAVMPHLLLPIVKESLGITLSTFKVTDKSGPATHRVRDWRSMAPFIVLVALSVFGIARVIWLLTQTLSVGLFVLLFWLVRNLYFLSMSLFLVDGRDSDGENVKVQVAEPASVTVLKGIGTLSGPAPGTVYEGVTTQLTEHNACVFLDDAEELRLGSQVELAMECDPYSVKLRGVITQVVTSRNESQRVFTVEILDFGDDWGEYLQVLYDRVPTLPQRLTHDPGPVRYFWRNLATRIGHTS
jgi:cellulose synthase (UDP-forming)